MTLNLCLLLDGYGVSPTRFKISAMSKIAIFLYLSPLELLCAIDILISITVNNFIGTFQIIADSLVLQIWEVTFTISKPVTLYHNKICAFGTSMNRVAVSLTCKPRWNRLLLNMKDNISHFFVLFIYLACLPASNITKCYKSYLWFKNNKIQL